MAVSQLLHKAASMAACLFPCCWQAGRCRTLVVSTAAKVASVCWHGDRVQHDSPACVIWHLVFATLHLPQCRSRCHLKAWSDCYHGLCCVSACSKEISKSNVVDDMVASNSILYEPGEHPDHTVVIK